MGSLKDLLAKAGQGAAITLTASHKETINMGNYESISPFVSMSLTVSDPTVDPDALYQELCSEVDKAFEAAALEDIRGVIDRRMATNQSASEVTQVAQYYKK